MYIAQYKSVNSSNEFYAKTRNTLDYPTQVIYMKERYSLFCTYIVASPTQEKNITKRLTDIGIKFGIDVDGD